MSVSFEKLQQLWKNRESVLAKESDIKQRAEQIYKVVELWEKDRDSILAIKDYGSPSDKHIPTDSWSAVKNLLRQFYEAQPELRVYAEQVDDVSEFLHLQYRDERFRVSSNAKGDLPYENMDDIHPRNYCNPETHFASHNFPFEIIKFLFSCSKSAPFLPLHLPADNRFIPKYIWMLANREHFIPILSLQSFRESSPLFRELAKDVAWADREDRWALPLIDFVKAWPAVSNQLCRRITEREYSDLPDKEKRTLAILLFIASVAQTTAKNAFDMIQTGNKAIILYGPPGTGKTYYAQRLAEQLFTLRESKDEAAALESVKTPPSFDACNFTKLFGNSSPPKQTSLSHGCWEIIQFHPAYSYHDFIGGIMPNVDNKDLSYTKKEGVFKRFCDAASVNPHYPFILIIDEINRANLSSVFGELMYALEYRGTPVNTLQFGLFSIPKNVYIIGTMNTTDKSLVTFDLALRRRFLFMKLLPQLSTLEDWNYKDKTTPLFTERELRSFIANAEILNKALVAPEGLDLPEDYAIGQAYFMKILDFCAPEEDGTRRMTEFAREQLWDYHLEPLIEEYLGAEVATRKSKIKELRANFTKQEQGIS